MKLGFFSVALSDLRLEPVLQYLQRNGVQAIELSTRVKTGIPHLNMDELLQSPEKQKEFLSLLGRYEIEISALSCHGNPIHPQSAIAQQDHHDFERTVLLAEKLGVRRVITFSGCPGDSNGAKHPNWVTCPWPDEYLKVLDFQWNDILLPYWEKAAHFAHNHGVDMICLEMHPGFCVYNPGTLLRLRQNTSSIIGANLDPSHLFWQGIDLVAAIRMLGSSIYHFHAKDIGVNALNSQVNGFLDTTPFDDEIKRSWSFKTVGYGHGTQVWKDIIRELAAVGYDHVLSIEHEDIMMPGMEGLGKAILFLKTVMIN